MEENSKTYNEWTSRRPWKERKRIAKASKSFSQIQEPELIFYGRNSGVVGLSKHDVYRKVDDHGILQFGYDKVYCNICLSSHISVPCLIFFFLFFLSNLTFCIIILYWNLLQVLVDAECTHDGSVKHIQKFEQWGWITLQRRVLDAERTDDLTVLQVHTYLLLYLHVALSEV